MYTDAAVIHHVRSRRKHSSKEFTEGLEETSSESRVKCSSWRREHKRVSEEGLNATCVHVAEKRYAKIAASSQSCDSIFRVTRRFPPQRTHLLIIISYAQRVNWTQGCPCPRSEQYPHKILSYRCFKRGKKRIKTFLFFFSPTSVQESPQREKQDV